jgi:hypothetical protein
LQGQGKLRQALPGRYTAGGLCFFHANPDKASELGWGAITTGKNLGAILGLLPACS